MSCVLAPFIWDQLFTDRDVAQPHYPLRVPSVRLAPMCSYVIVEEIISPNIKT